MISFRLTPDAKSDLIEIRRYTLQQWGATQSEKYLSELRHRIRLLAENPYLGMSRPEVSKDVLSFPHASHIIYYLVSKDQLIVFGVLHKRMVPTHHLNGREQI